MVSNVCRKLILPPAIILLVHAAYCSACLAQPEAALAENTKPVSTDSNNATQQKDALRNQKRQKITVGFYVLWGIVLLGIFTILITMVMGRALRRIARKQAPQSSTRDELWYLKPEKQHKPPETEESPQEYPE